MKEGKIPKIARNISPTVGRVLWGRAAARCEFEGCNRRLDISPVTKESGNFSQKAHIYSFSPDGPRGRGPYAVDTDGLNSAQNLMLVCYDCHKKIDADKDRYPTELLKRWKVAHENRVNTVTAISPNKASHVLMYGAKIGDESSPLHFHAVSEAMFPDWYPAQENAINLSMHSAADDSSNAYWQHQVLHLEKEFDRHVLRFVEDSEIKHLSVFGLAPQPLLIRLGSLITDKVLASVYQLHREPRTWRWLPHPEEFKFIVKEPSDTTGSPVLVFSLSARIERERIEAIMGPGISVWEVTISECHNDFLQSEAQLALFRQVSRRVLAQIKTAIPTAAEIAIFPAMPVSCALELGRVRMPKADIPWVIYDQNNKHNGFIKTVRIGSNI